MVESLDPARLSTILLSAPGRARVGLTSADVRLRERAADALAATIVEHLNPVEVDERQIALPLSL